MASVIQYLLFVLACFNSASFVKFYDYFKKHVSNVTFLFYITKLISRYSKESCVSIHIWCQWYALHTFTPSISVSGKNSLLSLVFFECYTKDSASANTNIEYICEKFISRNNILLQNASDSILGSTSNVLQVEVWSFNVWCHLYAIFVHRPLWRGTKDLSLTGSFPFPQISFNSRYWWEEEFYCCSVVQLKKRFNMLDSTSGIINCVQKSS